VPILADVLWYITGNAVPQAAIWLIGESPARAGNI
jgi:hypothetical protein